MAIPFTQFLLPYGRRKSIEITRSPKHYVSGHSTKSPRFRHKQLIDLKKEEEKSKKQQSLPFNSVHAAFQQTKPK